MTVPTGGLIDAITGLEGDRAATLTAGAGNLYENELSRALGNLDRAINGDKIARTAVFTALSNIQRALKNAAHDAWIDDCRELAEREMSE